jgi:hypothetical protein
MKGRTSIKVVLDALWKSDPAMRAQFAEWTAWPADDTRYATSRRLQIVYNRLVPLTVGAGEFLRMRTVP